MDTRKLADRLAKELLNSQYQYQIEPGEDTSNNLPPTVSPWRYLAESLGLGVADLGAIAEKMGYDGFIGLQDRETPATLYADKGDKFVEALREASPQAAKIRGDVLISVLEEV